MIPVSEHRKLIRGYNPNKHWYCNNCNCANGIHRIFCVQCEVPRPAKPLMKPRI